MDAITATSNIGTTTQGALLVNDFRSNNEIHIQFTADNAGGTAAVNTIYPVPGAGSAARATLPAGVTYTGGSFTTYADLIDYLKHAGVNVVGIRLSTNLTDNWQERIAIADVPPFNSNIQERIIELTNFRETVGNGFADTLRIPQKFTANANTYLRCSIRKNSILNIYLLVDAVGAKTFVPLAS